MVVMTLKNGDVVEAHEFLKPDEDEGHFLQGPDLIRRAEELTQLGEPAGRGELWEIMERQQEIPEKLRGFRLVPTAANRGECHRFWDLEVMAWATSNPDPWNGPETIARPSRDGEGNMVLTPSPTGGEWTPGWTQEKYDLNDGGPTFPATRTRILMVRRCDVATTASTTEV